ncbi:MAG: PH domain-containing protein [Arenimonas sp.]
MTNNQEDSGTPAPLPVTETQRRLHPLSWLFVLLVQLRQFAFPLLALLVTGRSDRYELLPLIGVAALAVYSIFQYFTYHYRVLDNELIVRSGVFQKSVRHIPFSRIQNVSITQNVLHRLFNVAEVKLDAAGGVKPEAQMRVLNIADAHELEELIRGHANLAATSDKNETSSTQVEILHQLPLIDVVKVGLINNRGMIVIGAGVGVLSQTAGDVVGKLLNSVV